MISEEKYISPPVAVFSITSEINYHEAVIAAFSERRVMLDMALAQLTARADSVNHAVLKLVETLRSGHKVLVAGNGGSAAEAQHFAAELVGRFKREREPYAVLSLTTDTSTLTSIANDYGYQEVFARQVNGLGQAGDLLVLFSTSGESENIVRAAEAGKCRNMIVIALTGQTPSRLQQMADVTVSVPIIDTAIVQELHIVLTHILCDIIEEELSAVKEKAK